jgi:hypothetical protein
MKTSQCHIGVLWVILFLLLLERSKAIHHERIVLERDNPAAHPVANQKSNTNVDQRTFLRREESLFSNSPRDFYVTSDTIRNNATYETPPSPKSITTSRRRILSYDDYSSEWRQLNPNDRFFAMVGLVVAFLFCWCIMACICNCVRACCCPSRSYDRHRYTEIDSVGRTAYRDVYIPRSSTTGVSRPCMNALWGACLFECCCCRGNGDVDCCNFCVPLSVMECCCPP